MSHPFSGAEARGAIAIGLVVRRARRKLRITQRELGAHVSLSQPIISRLETGQLRGLRYRHVARIVAALSVNTKDWVGINAQPANRRLPYDPLTDEET